MYSNHLGKLYLIAKFIRRKNAFMLNVVGKMNDENSTASQVSKLSFLRCFPFSFIKYNASVGIYFSSCWHLQVSMLNVHVHLHSKRRYLVQISNQCCFNTSFPQLMYLYLPSPYKPVKITPVLDDRLRTNPQVCF